MKKILVLLLVLFATPVGAQTAVERIDKAISELEAAKSLLSPLPPKGPIYISRTDRKVQPKPSPVVLGAAGFAFTDPTFGSPMVRVTDATTSQGSSMRVPSSAHTTAWNTTGTKFFSVNAGGGAVFFDWDGTTLVNRGEKVSSQIEPQFSLVDPFLVYGNAAHRIRAWRLDTNTVTDVLNLDTTYPNLPLTNTYVGGMLLADNDVWIAHFGGDGIDKHVFVHHSKVGLLDIRGRGFFIHATSIDRTGRWVLVYPANDPRTGKLPVGISQVYRWDTQTGTLTAVTVRPSGHDAVGYGQWVNQDCCTTSTYDASQWQFRQLASLDMTIDLIPSPLTPQEIYLADHTNWRAARPDASVPIVSANYRFGDGFTHPEWYPWRAGDEEITAIAVDGSGTMWRFGHHQSVACTPNCDFWSEPMVNVSPNGRYAIFTSNWGQPTGRQDVFLIALR